MYVHRPTVHVLGLCASFYATVCKFSCSGIIRVYSLYRDHRKSVACPQMPEQPFLTTVRRTVNARLSKETAEEQKCALHR